MIMETKVKKKMNLPNRFLKKCPQILWQLKKEVASIYFPFKKTDRGNFLINLKGFILLHCNPIHFFC